MHTPDLATSDANNTSILLSKGDGIPEDSSSPGRLPSRGGTWRDHKQEEGTPNQAEMSGSCRGLKGREQAKMGAVRAEAGPPDGPPQMPGQQKGLALEGAESHRVLRKMEPQAEMELRRGVSRGGRGTSSGKDGGARVCAC